MSTTEQTDMQPQNSCPLCHSAHTEFYWQDKKRDYWQCHNCQLVFVLPEFFLSPEQVKAEYDKHDNTRLDDGYRRFLNRTLNPIVEYYQSDERSKTTLKGLDFGCGEGAFFSQMAREQGLQVENYDLYYHHYPELLQRQYDFIAMTEVLEHIAAPSALLAQLKSLLKPRGFLAIMTKRVLDKKAFSTWHYKNDPTHICFFSEATFQWTAEQLGMRLKVVEKDVVFLIAAD